MRILVIEDDSRVAAHVCRSLGDAGHSTCHCADGREGLLHAAAESFDVIVLDRMLPRVDGLKLLRTLRASGDATPVLILSALGDVDERVAGLRGSGDDFDRLNATLNDMLARIEALLESVRRVSDNVAHELRTPLARLRASLEEARLARGEGAADVDDAIAEAGALEKTFDAVLRIARLESGRHGAVFSPVDLSATLAFEDAGPGLTVRGSMPAG